MKFITIIFPADTAWRRDQASRVAHQPTVVAPAPVLEPHAEGDSIGEEVLRLVVGTIVLLALVFLY